MIPFFLHSVISSLIGLLFYNGKFEVKGIKKTSIFVKLFEIDDLLILS